MQKKEIRIYIGREADDTPSGPRRVKPLRPSDYLARRSRPLIRFWDLGQINHGDPASPVWEDHPILKTPGYTTEPQSWGASFFAGVRYNIAGFGEADYQNYVDMLFQYPVTEWKRRYRQIKVTATDMLFPFFDTDLRVSLRDSATTSLLENFLPDAGVSRAFYGDDLESVKQAFLDQYRWVWDRDKHGVTQRDLDELTSNIFPFSSATVMGGYFGLSTGRKSEYKLTTVNDFNAPDAGTILPTGPVDVFLFPQISVWACTSNSGDWQTTNILGPVYQVNPRHKWPRYQAAAFSEAGDIIEDGEHGITALVYEFLEYQRGRDGMQASGWTRTGTGTGGDYAYSETPIAPGSWSEQAKFGFCNFGEWAFAGTFFVEGARGGQAVDNAPAHSTVFRGTGLDDDVFGTEFFGSVEPMLTAVVQAGGRTYYVWALPDEFGNFPSFQTRRQRDRFRLSRWINWNSGIVGGLPLQPRDGTGSFYDL